MSQITSLTAAQEVGDSPKARQLRGQAES